LVDLDSGIPYSIQFSIYGSPYIGTSCNSGRILLPPGTYRITVAKTETSMYKTYYTLKNGGIIPVGWNWLIYLFVSIGSIIVMLHGSIHFKNLLATQRKLSKIRSTKKSDIDIIGENKYYKQHLNEGLKRAKLKKYEEAIENFDDALSVKPFLVIAWFEKGKAHLKLDEYKEAYKCFKWVVRIDKTFTEAKTLARLYKVRKLAF